MSIISIASGTFSGATNEQVEDIPAGTTKITVVAENVQFAAAGTLSIRILNASSTAQAFNRAENQDFQTNLNAGTATATTLGAARVSQGTAERSAIYAQVLYPRNSSIRTKAEIRSMSTIEDMNDWVGVGSAARDDRKISIYSSGGALLNAGDWQMIFEDFN